MAQLHEPAPARALLWCTFNGAANCTNGIGRQTQTLLGALDRRWSELTARTGDFIPYLAIPEPGPATWAYDPDRLARTRAIVERRGGSVISLPYDTSADFWSVPAWRQLSGNASRTARQLAARYAHVAVIAIDTPFAGTARAYLDAGPLPSTCGTVNIMQALCGTTRLNQHDPDPAQLAWELRALSAAGHHGVTIADISRTFTAHLRREYNVNAAHLTRFSCCLDLTDPDLQPMPPSEARQVATAYGVPLDRPIVLAVGRTDPVKGLDQLITALIPLVGLVHLVAVIVPFDGADPLSHSYQQQIADAGIRVTYVDRFSRELPRALASLPNTAAVACPSRSESQGYLPLEVALWARHGGPIVVAPALGGFTETITHERTGLLYDPGTAEALTATLHEAINLPAPARTAMAQQAYQRVTRERDVVAAYADTLSSTLTPA